MTTSGNGADSRLVTPPRLAHVVLRTSQFSQMVAWWSEVLQAHVSFENAFLCFLTFDDEHHRIAIAKVPGVHKGPDLAVGMDHVAFTYDGIADLLFTYERLAGSGIEPYWAVNHGPTLSLYYRDPDANQVELQVDRFTTAAEATAFLSSEAFRQHPIGHSVDVEDLLRRHHSGTSSEELLAYRYD